MKDLAEDGIDGNFAGLLLFLELRAAVGLQGVDAITRRRTALFRREIVHDLWNRRDRLTAQRSS